MQRAAEVRSRGRPFALLYAALGGAVAWLLRLHVGYPLVEVSCRAGTKLPLLAVSALSIAVTVGAGLTGWWLGRGSAADADALVAPRERRRFWARAAVALNAIFLLAILTESSAVLFGDPCLGIGDKPGPVGSLLLLLLGGVARADVPASPADAGWATSPWALAGVCAAAAVYARGVTVAWRRGRGRGLPVRRVILFGAGIAVLAAAILSPLDGWAGLLFSAHMAQHLLLTLAVAPLLAAAGPGTAALLALPQPARGALLRAWRRAPRLRRALRLLARTGPVVLLHAAAVWIWHVPRLYEAALRSEPLHALEHASFLGTAFLFWRLVYRLRASGGAGIALLAVFATALQSGFLGVLILLAPRAWYPGNAAGAEAVGLTAVEDQQLAGLVMWVPGGAVYLVAGILLAHAWIQSSEDRVRRRERALGWRTVALLLVATSGLACRGGAADAARDGLAAVGEGGRIRCELAARPDPPPLGAIYEVVATVRDARTGAPLDGAAVTIDATMPEHGHGMTTRPEQEALGDGRYLARGMKLHMPGRWVYAVTARTGDREDRCELPYDAPPGRP